MNILRANVLLLTVILLLLGRRPLWAQPDTPGIPIASQPLASDTDDIDDATGPVKALIERYVTNREVLGRSYAVRMSERTRSRLYQFQKAWQRKLEDVDFDALDQGNRVDYLLLKNHLGHELQLLDKQRADDQQLRPLIPFAEAIVELEESRRWFKKIDPATAAQELAELSEQIKEVHRQVRAGLQAEPAEDAITTTRSIAYRASQRLSELRRSLADWNRFYSGYDPTFSWWTKNPSAKADTALADYTKFITEKIVNDGKPAADRLVGDPIGEQALLAELAYEMIAYTPDELIEIANKEFQWCRAERLKASRDMGFGEDWRKALNHVKSQHVPPGEQPALIRRLAIEAVEFLDKRDLVTIPDLCRETWRMEMMTPARQKVSPYFTGGEVISVSFPTEAMDHADKLMSLRGNNIHFSRATVQHELIPGHHLQIFMAERYRPYRQLFRTPFLVEGWALYWEMLLWDLGFPQSPENRMGMLFWRSHRCARIIFSLNYHLNKWTPEQCVDFLVDQVGHERRNATAEVRRSIAGDYGPLYQAAYMLGGLQFRALRRELVDSGKMNDKQFHDAILKENSIPVAMIRASLTQQELTREVRTDWRFYD